MEFVQYSFVDTTVNPVIVYGIFFKLYSNN